MTAKILEKLEEACPGFLSKVDLFAGASTEGILALGLASNLSPTQVREMYEKFAKQVFENKPWRVRSGIEKFDQLVEADYSHATWITEEVLRKDLQSILLTDAYVKASRDLSSTKVQKAIVNRRGKFVALVDEEKIFQKLVDSQAFLEDIGRNLARPVDD